MPNKIYHDASEGLGPFEPSGDPENLNAEGGAKPGSEFEIRKGEIDGGLASLGAGIKTAKKYSSLDKNAQKIDVPMESQESIYNRKS